MHYDCDLIEVNPGPILSKKTKLSFAVWNLDSIPARDFARIPLIETFQATYDFDLFGVCESLLNKDIAKGDITINGFSPEPLRADKPENVRNGGVCLYFKENLPIKERRDLEILPETIVAEIRLNRKKKGFVLSYCHQENPTVTILTGDFNVRSPLFSVSFSQNRGRV